MKNTLGECLYNNDYINCSSVTLKKWLNILLKISWCTHCKISSMFDQAFVNIKTYEFKWRLKVQSCKLYNEKYMIALAPLTNTAISAFMAVLVFKLLSRQ